MPGLKGAAVAAGKGFAKRSRVTRRSGLLASWLSLGVLSAALLSGIAAVYSARQYYALRQLADVGARYAAVHGATSDSRYMRPGGTTTALRQYLARRTSDHRVNVSVSPADPNTLAPGTFVTVTVERPLVPQLLSSIVLRSSSSATVVH
jgi:hypothetical protein